MEIQITNAMISGGAITSSHIAGGIMEVATARVRAVVYARADGSILVSGELTLRTIALLALRWLKERL